MSECVFGCVLIPSHLGRFECARREVAVLQSISIPALCSYVTIMTTGQGIIVVSVSVFLLLSLG